MVEKQIINTNDLCTICGKCEYDNNIYDCKLLNKMINEKKLEYVWCWICKK